MADAVIQVPPDSTGKMVDNTSLVVGVNTVHRQRGNIASPSNAAGIADVTNTPPTGSEYGLLTRPVPVGCSKNHLVLAATTNATSIKASAGQVYAVRIFTNAAYPIFIHFSDNAAAPTPGVTAVVETIGVQAGMSYFGPLPFGDSFTTGIGYWVSKGITDADATAVALNDGVIDVFYK